MLAETNQGLGLLWRNPRRLPPASTNHWVGCWPVPEHLGPEQVVDQRSRRQPTRKTSSDAHRSPSSHSAAPHGATSRISKAAKPHIPDRNGTPATPGLAQARDLGCGRNWRYCISLVHAFGSFTISAQQPLSVDGGEAAPTVSTYTLPAYLLEAQAFEADASPASRWLLGTRGSIAEPTMAGF